MHQLVLPERCSQDQAKSHPCPAGGAWQDNEFPARKAGAGFPDALPGDSGTARAEGAEGGTRGGREEDLLTDVCREVVEKWSEAQIVDAKENKADELQAIASMMEKQARIVVKPKEISQEEKQRKAALLAQYANVTDEEDGEDEQDGSAATAVNIGSEKSLFRNTNVEDVLNARKLERELLRDEFQKKKEQDKLQREKDKLAKQERKEKEKKRTQKGERKR
ncbi:PREDICTED: coiled-coil domain-containing protein 43 [Chaetura pelagica]|uniref:coiled-coil domain-containing protein 43 n=1 Tax=Chaetura pelagica TaxID=8897 RepID=UPI0005231820|nr:PREDICTED: coiled-coil domain-containing protein 43 [Chaetura pelagica]